MAIDAKASPLDAAGMGLAAVIKSADGSIAWHAPVLAWQPKLRECLWGLARSHPNCFGYLKQCDVHP